MANYFEDRVLKPAQWVVKKDDSGKETAELEGTELEILYHKGLEEVDRILEENGGTIMLKRGMKKIWDKDHTSYKPIPPIALPSEIPIYLDSLGAINVRYSQYTPQRNGKIVTYPGKPRLYGESMLLTRKERDFAWFILVATSFVKRGEKNKNTGIFKVFNPTEILQKKAADVQDRYKVEAILSNPESKYFNLESITMFADKFGINTDKMELDIAAYTVREQILEGDTNNNPAMNVKRFLDYAKVVGKKVKSEPITDPDLIIIPDDGWSMAELKEKHYYELNTIMQKIEMPVVGSMKRAEKEKAIFDEVERTREERLEEKEQE